MEKVGAKFVFNSGPLLNDAEIDPEIVTRTAVSGVLSSMQGNDNDDNDDNDNCYSKSTIIVHFFHISHCVFELFIELFTENHNKEKNIFKLQTI